MFHFIRPGIIEIMNLKVIFSLLFLKINISVTIYDSDLKSSVCILDILLQGQVSQIFYFGS